MIKVIPYDNIFFKLGTTFEQDLELKKYMSVMIENAWFHPKVKSGVWDGKISFYDSRNSLFPIGLWQMFKDFCIKREYKYKCEFNENNLTTNLSDEKLEKLFEVVFKDSKFNPYNYQKEAISNAIRERRGILLSPTGSGKSLIIYTLIRYLLYLEKDILLVVPTTNLVEQMYNDFIEYGYRNEHLICRLYSGMEYDEECPILISTWQSLQNKPKEFFDRFEGLLIDECLHPDTLIDMADETKKKISEIKIGDMVKSLNEHGEIENKKVTKIHRNLSKDENKYKILDIDNNVIFKNGITGNHKIKVENEYKRIDKLNEGDELIERS